MSAPAASYDVAVVGFGPTGAVLANLLGREGLRARVVEREHEVHPLPRAVHFDDEAMRIFQSLGLAEAILPHTGPVQAYEFRNAEGKLLLCFEPGETVTGQGWRASYMFHQPALERALREGAAARESVDVCLGEELVALEQDAEGVSLHLRDALGGDEETVRARFAVGCDGASSATRRMAGLAVEDLGFDEPWLVVDATAKRPLEEIGFPRVPLQHCDPRRPTTLIPVVGPYVRWEFMLLPGEGREIQEPARVRELVSAWVDPDAVQVIRSAVYRFHAIVASRWRAGRVLLAGDAAHQMPPFLGQGMCAGLRDAANLAWKLRRVIDGSATPELLGSYAEERAPHVRSVIDTAVEMGRVVCTRDPEVARARDGQLLSGEGRLARAGAALPPLPGLACGLLEPGPRHPLAGSLGLQARVRDAAGREGLLDDLVGPGFVLLWRGAPEPLGAAARETARRLDVRPVGFAPDAPAAADDGSLVLADPYGHYAAWLDRHGARAVLLRPDRVVFGVAADARAADALLGELARALAGAA